MADTPTTSTTPELGLTGIVGSALLSGLFSDQLGTSQKSGVDYGSLAALANASAGTAMNAAGTADASNKVAYTQIQPAITAQLGTAKTASGSMMDLSGQLGEQATTDIATGNAFNPVATQYASDALNYGNATDQENAANKAGQTALQNTQQAKAAALDKLSAMGVDTGSGKLASALMGAGMAGAAAQANAENTARETTRQAGIQMRGQATQVGNQVKQVGASEATASGALASNAAQTAGQGISSAVAGANLNNAATDQIINASNLGVNANVGIAKAQADDAYRYSNLNNQASSSLGKAITASLGTSAAGNSNLASTIKDATGAVWDGAKWIYDAATGGSSSDTTATDNTINQTVDDQTQASGNVEAPITGEGLTKEWGGWFDTTSTPDVTLSDPDMQQYYDQGESSDSSNWWFS